MGGKLEEIPGPSEGMQESSEKQIAEATDNSETETIAPVCPKCGGRINRKGCNKRAVCRSEILGMFELPQMQVYQKSERGHPLKGMSIKKHLFLEC